MLLLLTTGIWLPFIAAGVGLSSLALSARYARRRFRVHRGRRAALEAAVRAFPPASPARTAAIAAARGLPLAKLPSKAK